ncbi:hypothetical protein AALA78_14980 [Lachnospiraceae bacterium 42-17]
MKKLTATKGLEKEKWLMYRKRGIGGLWVKSLPHSYAGLRG